MKNAKKYSWSEYFGDLDKVDQTHNGTALYDNESCNNYYVFECTFEDCTENGAIYIKEFDITYTLLEDSIFNRCKSTSEDGGGSVYLSISSGSSVQQRNCYIKSIAADYFMAFFQYCFNKNYIFEISVSNCGENESVGEGTFLIYYGDIRIKNNNSTYNKCSCVSSITSFLVRRSGYCNFSTFRENNSTVGGSLGFASGYDSDIYTVSYCNVIGNNCGTDSEQYIFGCSCNTTVEQCVFLNNTAVYMFYIESEGFTLTITDSFVESKSTTGPGIVKFERDRIDPETISISHLDIANCLIGLKVTISKVSYFFAIAVNSILLLVKKMINCIIF
ncbi:hypothetical protein TVAG_317600 [Trichomonas vaginalis G3]|uniref:Polymorphic repeat outer membrane protein n=1 Tax=Trichomonas vaginalis (strain ATCC PRA-98 / G3) TaxID=412133 RepID=A2FTK9_TRIV3|nr:hypothetical protein TVAG_317600 [Trichomonas vaginalis G3]|eukprot:XP_001304701.1 hypothetical protein [Trichomonas vaginalis G3]